MKRPIAIIVLDDGETWGGIDGASICFITEEQHESLCDGSILPRFTEPVFELGLADVTPPKEIETIYRVKDGGTSD